MPCTVRLLSVLILTFIIIRDANEGDRGDSEGAAVHPSQVQLEGDYSGPKSLGVRLGQGTG
jgi:hypothetical protein